MTRLDTPPTFASKSSPDDVGALVSVLYRKNGWVIFLPIDGGTSVDMNEHEFDAFFGEVDEARLGKLLGKWRRDYVEVEDAVGQVLAWHNDYRWNGFASPSFTKADVVRGIGNGPLAIGENGGVFWSEKAGAYVVLENGGSTDGARPMTEIDFAPLADRLLAGEEIYNTEFEGHIISADLAKPTVMAIAGRKVETFTIGENWTWTLASEFEADLDEEPEFEPVPKITPGVRPSF